MNHHTMQKMLERSLLWRSLTLAVLFAATASFFLPHTLFAQSTDTNTMLPIVVLGDDAIPDVSTSNADIPTNTIPELNPSAVDVSSIAESQGDGELSALWGCTIPRVSVAFQSQVNSTYLGYSDRGNGIVDYGYWLRQEIDYFVYVKCGSTYYKYRVYGEVQGSQICNSYKITLPVQLTCENPVWDAWKATSGYGYIGSGTNPWF